MSLGVVTPPLLGTHVRAAFACWYSLWTCTDKAMRAPREIGVDILFVRSLVGNPHNGNAVLKGDMQSAMAIKALHTASYPLIFLANGRLLVSVVRGSLGLTAFVGEPSCRSQIAV